MKVSECIRIYSKKLLSVGIESNILDTEIILAYSLNKKRIWLHANYDYVIKSHELLSFKNKIGRRLNREPVAYITNKKEFYGYDFYVNKSVLIPRPETETIVDLAISHSETYHCQKKVLDIGCGSGAIGLSIKKTKPQLEVTLSDINDKALKVAVKNSKRLSADVKIIKTNLLKNIKDKPDIIVANLPYIDIKETCSPETKYEPQLAIFAPNNGYDLIFKLISQAKNILNKNSALILECDNKQIQKIVEVAIKNDFKLIKNKNISLYFIKN